MSVLRTTVGLCLLLAPFAATGVLSMATIGLRGTAVVFGAVAVVLGCVVGGLMLLGSD